MKPKQLDCQPIPGEVPETVYRDDDIWVVNKPQGWLTHTDGATTCPDLVTWCGEPVGVHQRLDVDTTGVVAFSRSPQGARRLNSAFAERTAKRYLAVVSVRPRHNRQIRTPMPTGRNRTAHTRYALLSSHRGGHVLELEPITGRTHQLRFHLASEGSPILGDARYGGQIDRRAPRTLLHCAELQIPGSAPWHAPIPADLEAYLSNEPGSARKRLRTDPNTTCFREFNGAADGYPGWRVDRYDEWLWIQHDEGHPEGPRTPPVASISLTANGIVPMGARVGSNILTERPLRRTWPSMSTGFAIE